MSNHNTKIFKLDEINLLNISPLGIKNISDNNIKYLLIYLWNVIGESTSQIFIQINNLKVSNINNNVITFDLLDNSDITHINLIEEQIINIFKEKLIENIDDSNNITFISLVNNYNDDEYKIKLSTNYNDYNTTVYNNKESNEELVLDSCVNIIIELVGIQYDINNKILFPDFRLRQIVKKIKIPERIKLSEYSFIDSENEEDNIIECNNNINNELNSVSSDILNSYNTSSADESCNDSYDDSDDIVKYENNSDEIEPDTETMTNNLKKNKSINSNE